MSGMHYRRHSRNQEDDWEKRRLAAVERLNKSNTGGRQTQPQPWTLQYYMLEWHEHEWRLKPLQHPVKSTHDRLKYAAEHEWSTLALQTQVFACFSGQSHWHPCWSQKEHKVHVSVVWHVSKAHLSQMWLLHKADWTLQQACQETRGMQAQGDGELCSLSKDFCSEWLWAEKTCLLSQWSVAIQYASFSWLHKICGCGFAAATEVE